MIAAHSANRHGVWEPLTQHLGEVSRLAATFAEPLGFGQEASAAGALHDVGKLGGTFQERLRGMGSGLDHWSPGAWAALTRFERAGVPMALAVQGHHVGLQQWDADALRAMHPRRLAENHPLGLRLSLDDHETALQYLAVNSLLSPAMLAPRQEGDPHAAAMLDVRLLYSCLVDADFLATESHFEAPAVGERYARPTGPLLDAERALALVLAEALRLQRSGAASAPVQWARDELLASCLQCAEARPGTFTLTAPTGCGKTLAMVAFALRHAAVHALRRVVVVVPYLSIIEQTAQTLRRILEPVFGEHYVLEHHSLANGRDLARDTVGLPRDWAAGPTLSERMLAENWDAPLIITTSVQLLESLFSNRPAACRKLHRLARAVVLFDEVQTLPTAIAVPTLGALARLSQRFGTSVVFATATQPAFGHLHEDVQGHCSAGWMPQEIVRDAPRLFDGTRRVEIEWPDLSVPTSWPTLAARLRDTGSALCVVNLKRHAQELVAALQACGVQHVTHLSTSMCPAHRSEVLESVRGKLRNDEPCILVSTQCVEAGVDIDFPHAFRAFGPLDAIAQVAGRCNRHGTRERGGKLVVFLPEEEQYPPGGGYGQAAATAKALLREMGGERLDLARPETFDAYYRRLYDLIDPANANADLADAIKRRDFVGVARSFRVIDQNAVNLLVAYDGAAFAALREELARKGRLSAHWVRRARPHAINLFRGALDRTLNLEPVPAGDGESTDWYVYIDPSHYSPLLGLVIPEAPDTFVL